MYDIPFLEIHSVNDKPGNNPMGALSVSPQGLDAYLKVFTQEHYRIISFTDFLEEKYDKTKKFAVLTFDDGFRDNLYLALPVLKKYGARATVFVNPGFADDKCDKGDNWGFMSWDEIRQAEASGVFDVQAHTMTHYFVFKSDKIIDYYTPEKFNKYYWLAWMLYPGSAEKWDSTAEKYRDMIPLGYPIFEYGRLIDNIKFTPSEEYVQFVINEHNKNTGVEFNGSHGTFESEEEHKNIVAWQIGECKRILEEKLNKQINIICFPGGGYDEAALKIAEQCGYKSYALDSHKRTVNNYGQLEKLKNGEFTGFYRTVFSLIHPGFLKDEFFDYWVAKLSLNSFQNNIVALCIKKILALFVRR